MMRCSSSSSVSFQEESWTGGRSPGKELNGKRKEEHKDVGGWCESNAAHALVGVLDSMYKHCGRGGGGGGWDF